MVSSQSHCASEIKRTVWTHSAAEKSEKLQLATTGFNISRWWGLSLEIILLPFVQVWAQSQRWWWLVTAVCVSWACRSSPTRLWPITTAMRKRTTKRCWGPRSAGPRTSRGLSPTSSTRSSTFHLKSTVCPTSQLSDWLCHSYWLWAKG